MRSCFDEEAGPQAILLLGTFTQSEGMYRYFEACVDDLERKGVEVRSSLSGLQLSLLRPIRACLSLGYSTYPIMIILLLPWVVISVVNYCQKLQANSVTNLRIVDDFVFSSIHLFLLRCFFRHNITVTIHDPSPHTGHIKNWRVNWVYHTNRFALVLFTKFFKSFRIHIHAVRLWLNATYFGNVSTIISPHPIPNRLASIGFNQEFAYTFIFIGRLEPYKGLQIFLDAVAKFRDEHSLLFKSATFAVCGRGDVASYDWHNLQTNSNFYFNNRYISRHDFEQYILSAGFIVLPYIDATSSGVGALAVAYDRPVIVTDVGDLESFAEHNKKSFVLEEISANHLKQAMVNLLLR